VERGEYNWVAWLTECIRDSEQMHTVSDYRHTALEQRDIPGKGRGMVAAEALPRHTLLLVEKAAAIAFPGACMAKRKAPGDMLLNQLKETIVAAQQSAKERRVVAGLKSLSIGKGEPVEMEQDAEQFLRRALVVNGFAWSDGCKANIMQVWKLFLSSSFFSLVCFTSFVVVVVVVVVVAAQRPRLRFVAAGVDV
jgi:hypothetical protein